MVRGEEQRGPDFTGDANNLWTVETFKRAAVENIATNLEEFRAALIATWLEPKRRGLMQRLMANPAHHPLVKKALQRMSGKCTVLFWESPPGIRGAFPIAFGTSAVDCHVTVSMFPSLTFLSSRTPSVHCKVLQPDFACFYRRGARAALRRSTLSEGVCALIEKCAGSLRSG